jgi:hypothetical protein
VLSVRTLQRELSVLLPDARSASGGDGALELIAPGGDAPRLISATVLEGSVLRAHRVLERPVIAFRGFLDGTQRSRVVSHLGVAPLILGDVAAVVRDRHHRRMRTWRAPLLEQRVYAPRAVLGEETWATLLRHFGGTLVDTTDGEASVVGHPFALRDAAFHRVQAHREALEQRLAERWCGEENDPLFIDGGISGSEAVARSGCAVGVVKSHRTLYAEGDALSVVLGLRHGERSSVFRITSAKRTTVASWYLRLRDHSDHDPMWGLVRVEVRMPDVAAAGGIRERANEVSRWILAEASPLALPDSRWDKMVYGIRDCEEYLRAVT